jgi:hypothetical protein
MHDVLMKIRKNIKGTKNNMNKHKHTNIQEIIRKYLTAETKIEQDILIKILERLNYPY